MPHSARFNWTAVKITLSQIRHFRNWRAFRAARKDKPPIFIVGCGHSGTSLLIAILGVHSHIYAVPWETCFAYDYKRREVRLIPQVELFLRRFDTRAIRAGKLRWAEKTPRHIYAIPELLHCRPQARIVIILRDGRDVAYSLWKKGESLQAGIERWVDNNRRGQAFWNHPNVYTLRYEDLIENFEPTLRKLLAFLGEEYEDQLARFHEVPKFYYAEKIEKTPDEGGSYHHTHRNWQINQKLFDGRGRWKALDNEQKQVIKEVAGDMLIEYGYAADKNW
jgi:hypothetical protein